MQTQKHVHIDKNFLVVSSFNNDLSWIKSRTDNLNYAISALKKNLELNQNYNDIKTFFNSLYPGGTPPPINIGTSSPPENQTTPPPPFD